MGLAVETEREHKARHPQIHPHCARCIYYALRTGWEQGHGCHRHVAGGNEVRTVWLAPRAKHLGGVWGLGCVFCAAYTARYGGSRAGGRDSEHGRVKRGSMGTSGGWSRFEVNALSQVASRGVQQHARTYTHLLATRAYFVPDAAVVVAGPVGLLHEDAELFRGGVPQVSDWISAWRACRTPVSFAAAEKFGITADFVYNSRKTLPVSRRAFKSMVLVMSSVLRARKRRLLSASRSITLSLDDRKAYRLLRFKCHTERPDTVEPSEWKGSVSGVLMVLHRGGTSATAVLGDMSDDYSRRMSESVVEAVRRLCTSADGELDQDAFDSICKSVRVGVADGAGSVQKALAFLASGAFPGMMACVRDMSHKARIATGDPLLADDGFSEWWDDVFGERHALVPDIQNSEAWLEKLALCQKALLSSDEGVRASGCVTVQRTMSFAKQRFDSYASPQMKFCVLFVSIAMLLAYQATDPRAKTEVRDRAGRRLEKMPHYVLPAGLAATYSAEALEFVRIFDVTDHDPALSWSQARDWRKRIEALFLEGHVWAESDDAEKTPMNIIWGQARAAKPIYYGNKVVHLFRHPGSDRQRSIMNSVHNVVRHTLDRLEVDFDIRRPEVAFSALDVSRWARALEDRRAGDHASEELLKSHARIMFKHWHLDADRGVRELEGCAILLLRQEADRRKDGNYLDNRILWARTLEASFLKSVSSFGRMRVMPELVPIYLSAMDGTGEVERGLGSLLRVLEAHSGPLSEDGEVASALTEVLLDGPADEAGLGTRPDILRECGSAGVRDVDVALQATGLTRAFASEWLATHGRRFRVYAGKPKKEPQPKAAPKKGSLARVMFDSKVARDRLVKRAQGAPTAADADITLLGIPRSRLQVGNGVPTNGPKTKMRQFALTTALRRTQLNALSTARDWARRKRVNPYRAESENPSKKLRPGKAVAWRTGVKELEPSRPGAPVRVLDCCSAAQTNLQGTRRYVLTRSPVDGDLFADIQRVDMLLCDNPWALDRKTAMPVENVLQFMFPAIATGKSVLPRSAWVGMTPHLSNYLVRFSRAASQEKVTLVVLPAFRLKFPRLCKIIDASARVSGSKWVVTDKEPPPEKPAPKAKAAARLFAKAKAKSKPMQVVVLSSCEDVREFVLKRRRIARSGGVASEYFRPSRAGRFGLGLKKPRQ